MTRPRKEIKNVPASINRRLLDLSQERQAALTKTMPEALQPEYYQDEERLARWRAFQRKVTPNAPVPTAFDAVGELIRSFLGPVRQSIVADTKFEATWQPDGPWQVNTSE